MPLPLKILNAFRLGRDHAARVAPSQPDRRAWVWIRPILAGGTTFAEASLRWNLSRQAEGCRDDTVVGFLIRHVEIDADEIDEWGGGMAFISPRLAVDEWFEADTVAAMEEILSRWLPDLSALRSPKAAGYRFRS